jgi:hypothetical protein
MFTDSTGRKWLTGDGTWAFNAWIEDDDLHVSEAQATWFGVNDPDDNGLGAWGFHVAAHPEYLGCALPLAEGPCHGSPLPRIPIGPGGIGPAVRIYCHHTGKIAYAHVVDLGPSKSTGHAIDLMPSVWVALGMPDFREVGVMKVDFCVLGAARYAE